jgi:hypothetical protein
MSKVKQTLPKGLILRALKNYRATLEKLKKDMPEDVFYVGHFGDDEFDLCSEIPMIEHSDKIEVTFNKDLYENWPNHSLQGVDYPMYVEPYNLYEIKEETKTIKRTTFKPIDLG